MIEILCECNILGCNGSILIDQAVVELARNSRCAIVIRGHQGLGEQIVSAGPDWLVVVDSDQEGNS